MKISVLFCLLILYIANCYSQALNKEKLDSLFDILETHKMAMGSVAISINGNIKYQRSIGDRNKGVQENFKADSLTVYRIGSTTKMFTAVMILQLVEEGKLKLEDRLAKYFSIMPNADSITIRDMLYHQSGLPEYTEPFAEFESWMDLAKTRQDMVRLIANKNAMFPPKTKTAYCNSNYLILSYIIEHLDRIPYAKSVENRIIKRISLTHTHYARPFEKNRNQAVSYSWSNSQWHLQKQTDTSIHQGAGLLASTPSDLTHFIEALYSGKLLKLSGIEQMIKWENNFGMGAMPAACGTITGFGHAGHIEGFRSSLNYYPSAKLSIAYCTNAEVYPKNEIVDIITKICLNQHVEIPSFDKIELPDSVYEKYVGDYLEKQLPLDITVTKGQGGLILSMKDHQIPIEPVALNTFIFRPMGFMFSFEENGEKLIIKETYKSYTLNRNTN